MDKQKYTRLNITLPSNLLDKFTEYCEKEGMMLSSRIAVLIRKDLESIAKIMHYRVLLLDDNNKGKGFEIITNKSEFVDNANLSKTKDEGWDREVQIIPIKSSINDGMNMTYPENKEKEIFYGKKVNIEKILKKIKYK